MSKIEGGNAIVKKLIGVLVVAALTVSFSVTGASAKVAKGTTAAATADVCVLLPDPKTSVRWETQDRPALVTAFTNAKVSYIINNANGDAQRQKTQADQCLANGAKVVILVSLDKGSSIAIEAAAKSRGAKVIEYDRQVVGGIAQIYISFDGRAVGVLQGKGVVAGLKANGMYAKKPVVAELHGGQTDNNSFLFKGGYESVLNPLYKNGTLKKGPQQFTPDWDNQKAGTIFEQMLVKTKQQHPRGRGGQRRPRERGRGRAEGAQAEADRAQRPGRDRAGRPEHHLRLADDDRLEGHAQARRASAAAAIAFLNGKKPLQTGTVANGPGKTIPAYIIPPVSINKANYKQLFNGYLKRSDVCKGAYLKYCK